MAISLGIYPTFSDKPISIQWMGRSKMGITSWKTLAHPTIPSRYTTIISCENMETFSWSSLPRFPGDFSNREPQKNTWVSIKNLRYSLLGGSSNSNPLGGLVYHVYPSYKQAFCGVRPVLSGVNVHPRILSGMTRSWKQWQARHVSDMILQVKMLTKKNKFLYIYIYIYIIPVVMFHISGIIMNNPYLYDPLQ